MEVGNAAKNTSLMQSTKHIYIALDEYACSKIRKRHEGRF